MRAVPGQTASQLGMIGYQRIRGDNVAADDKKGYGV
jgi:hypothetical protein